MWSPLRSTGAIVGLCLLALWCNIAAAHEIGAQEGIALLPDCARNCFQAGIGASLCQQDDVQCICADEKLNYVAAACIKSYCTSKESLAAKNITAHMCGHSEEKDGTLLPIYYTFCGLAVVAVILRVIARVVTHAYFWWDDLANLFGFVGCHVAPELRSLLTESQLGSALFTAMNAKSIDLGQGETIYFVPFDNVTIILKIFFGEMLLYTVTRFFVRASIILFYLRVFPPKSDNKLGRILLYTFIFNIVYNVSFLLAVIFQCKPISDFWTQWSGEHEGHCGNANILAWVAAATGIVFDLWLLVLPFPQLLMLNLHWKKKLMGGMMFFVGIAVMIISLIRLKTINEFTRAVNPTKDIVQVCLWSAIELDVGVICPCLPSFRLLLRRLLPRAMGTSGRYELDPVSGNGTGVMRSVIGGKVWAGLERKVRFAHEFVPIITSCRVLSESESTPTNPMDAKNSDDRSWTGTGGVVWMW
ncbi:hypothetical protein N0V88_008182 [Collariella sp. IMI 366227]|nr:hypothetical protein N0V88_008182 [Collariella sp. IMI 366227]